jgi:hypothetical protein
MRVIEPARASLLIPCWFARNSPDIQREVDPISTLVGPLGPVRQQLFSEQTSLAEEMRGTSGDQWAREKSATRLPGVRSAEGVIQVYVPRVRD